MTPFTDTKKTPGMRLLPATPPSSADHVSSMLSSLDRLIAEAPADTFVPGKTGSADPQSNLVRIADGWGKRYVEPIELRGEQWLRVFEEAKVAVANRGIVAFLGERGPGKTQMAAEVTRAGYWPTDAGEWTGNATVYGKTGLYRRAMDIFLDLRDANKAGSKTSEKEVLAKLVERGLLVIDEFQERGESDWENRVLTHLLDRRYAAERPTIIIANLTRSGLSQALSASVKDRMHENGRSFVFDWPSFRRPEPRIVRNSDG